MVLKSEDKLEILNKHMCFNFIEQDASEHVSKY